MDHHLLAGGVGEEVLRHVACAHERADEERRQDGEDAEAVPDAACEEGTVGGVELAAVGVAGVFRVGLEEVGGEERGEGDGEHPGKKKEHPW